MKDKVTGYNEIYKDLAENIGEEVALKIFERYRGQQVSFPLNLYSNEYITNCIREEYDGTNIRELARKYGYTERWIIHKIKES